MAENLENLTIEDINSNGRIFPVTDVEAWFFSNLDITVLPQWYTEYRSHESILRRISQILVRQGRYNEYTKAEINGLWEAHDNLVEYVEALEIRLDIKDADLQAQINALKVRMTNAENRLTAAEGRLSGHDSEIATIKTRLNGHDAYNTTNTARTNELFERVEALESKQVDVLTGEIVDHAVPLEQALMRILNASEGSFMRIVNGRPQWHDKYDYELPTENYMTTFTIYGPTNVFVSGYDNASMEVRVNGVLQENPVNSSTGKLTAIEAWVGQADVSIWGPITKFGKNTGADANQGGLLTVNQLSDSINTLYLGYTSLRSVPQKIPTSLTSLSRCFQNGTGFNQDIRFWNTSNITDFSYMFDGCTSFNGYINSWDVSNANTMLFMFNKCTNFNQPLNGWQTKNISNMAGMFFGCTKFNQPLSNWNVESVVGVSGGGTPEAKGAFHSMFNGCTDFNGDITTWRPIRSLNFALMFSSCSKFNQNLTGWKFTPLGKTTTYYDQATPAWLPENKPDFNNIA